MFIEYKFTVLDLLFETQIGTNRGSVLSQKSQYFLAEEKSPNMNTVIGYFLGVDTV
jgi:hypothetical protein